MKKRWFSILLCMMAVLLASGLPAAAEEAYGMRRIEEEPVYTSFAYLEENNGIVAVETPAPYRPTYVANSSTIGTSFSQPSDIFIYDDKIYILDSASGKILITNQNLRLEKEITGFSWMGGEEVFKNPEGLFVTKNTIYVADTGNQRLVLLGKDGVCQQIITAPQSELLSSNLVFEPKKVAVDAHGRIYTVVKGVYEGIMELYTDGSFAGFIGSIPVSPNPLLRFWKSIMSKEARSKLENFVPVEYTNLTVDESGFIYATSIADNRQQSIRRLNSAGSDILIRNSLGDIPVNGVVTDDMANASSNFVDIVNYESGLYLALDRKYGRVFAYDNFGNLLFTFGGVATNQSGTFEKASAIAVNGSRVFVADVDSGTITVFEQTEYARLILQGLRQYDNDQYEESIETWGSVQTLNRNCRLAYDKIGLAQYQLGRYKEAMASFKTAGNRDGYSKAFAQVRKEMFSSNFLWIVLGILAAVAAVSFLAHRLHRHFRKHPLDPCGFAGSLVYVFHVLRHPMDGFWDLKYEKRGRVWVSTLLIVLTVAAFAMERNLTAFALSGQAVNRLDWVYELKFVLIPLGLFLVANMSVTSLMDGKGSFRELYTASGYALAPFILVKIPVTLFSGLLTSGEARYVSLLSVLTITYVGVLAFSALMGTHEYTAGKTVGVMALTGVVMVIICFICVLFFFLFSEIVGFAYTIMEEVRYR